LLIYQLAPARVPLHPFFHLLYLGVLSRHVARLLAACLLVACVRSTPSLQRELEALDRVRHSLLNCVLGELVLEVVEVVLECAGLGELRHVG